MSSGTQSSSSTYSGGKGVSFAKDIASRVVDAAVAAKDEKKLQQKIIAKGGSVPEKDQKGLFVKALKQEFISNPINDLKKQFNKKAAKVGRVAGLFGARGEKIESKLGGGLFKIKQGFDRSGYKEAEKEKPQGGGSGNPLVTGLGELVVDIQQIATAISSIQGLINTQMSLSAKMSENIKGIKDVLAEQLGVQQDEAEKQETAQREASLESAKGNSASGTASSSSTFVESDMLGSLMGMFDLLKKLPEIMTTVRKAISGIGELFGTVVNKVKSMLGMGAEKAVEKGAQSAAVEGLEIGAEKGAEKLGMKAFGELLHPVVKKIPLFGGVLDFLISLALGENPGRAAARAIGSTLGGSLGALIGALVPGLDLTGISEVVVGALGAWAGDWVGGTLYDTATNLFSQKKMAAGGVMIGEAGPEAVVSLHGEQGKKMIGGDDKSSDKMQGIQDNYYSALAGSTLAVTSDFVQGLGPIGDSIAPVIQGKVSELGRDFKLPATTTRVSVGGSSLRSDPQAKRKGEEYLKQLVAGTLKKLFPDNKDDKKKKKSSGSSGTGDTPTPTPTPTNGGKADMVIGDSVARGLAGNGATPGTDKDAQKVGRNPEQTLQYIKGLDKSTLQGKTIRLSSGILNNTKDLKDVEEQIKYLTAAGAKVQLVGTPTNNPKFSGLNDQLKKLADQYKIDFLGGYTAGKDNTHPADYNKLNQQFNTPGSDTPNTPPNVKAEKGISITSNGGGNKPLLPGKTYGISDLNPHHSDEGRTRVYKGMSIGEPKDYGMGVLPQYMPSGPNGKVPLPVPGKVLVKEWDKKTGYGRTVIVDTSLGKIQFSHMSKFGDFTVGDQLAAGTIVGVQGGSGDSGESSYAEHLHVNATPKGHEAFVNFITSGKPTTGALGDDGKTDSPGNEDSGNNEDDMTKDPIGAIEKAFTGMVTGLSLMGLGMQGKINTKEEYDSAKTANKYDISLSQAGAPKDNPPQGSGAAPKPAPGRAPTPAAASPTGGQSRTPTLATPSKAPAASPAQLGGVGSMADTTLKHGTKPVSTGTAYAPV